ncbi:thioredoxin domain-containing protein [Pusillimonas sp. TS35]|uniref:thiol:disulfide interchange protein DsbA/DsbL n=1 Tax=Paracandidimonas lactea TaxID=2895524 RepID=UPI00136D5CFE|nr:thiol:disulfide interchange protein DsbA/DsbL [Paracandidimonas lactea]MYN12475.1 thioredoxin domain-containing protein [Pusillimonas sp. TS35]
MLLKQILARTLAIATLAASALLAPAAQAADPYVTLPQAQPSDTTGKIEVLEFFSYSCPHCAKLEPMVEKWVATLPKNVAFRAVPVAFNASMKDMQRLYYTLEAMNRLDLHSKVFNAIHNEHKRLYTKDAIVDWITTQGIDRKAFLDVFDSFGINAKISRADELTELYKIDGTPSLAVGGKYVTSPSMTGTYEGTIEQAQKLVELAGKTMN